MGQILSSRCIWQSLETSLVIKISSAPGMKWAEAREDAKHPTMHIEQSCNRELSSQRIINSVKIKKPCFRP